MSTKHPLGWQRSIPFQIEKIDWVQFQQQRHTLIDIVHDSETTLADHEIEHLTGLLHLTDAIIDCAKDHLVEIPTLKDILLDMVAGV